MRSDDKRVTVDLGDAYTINFPAPKPWPETVVQTRWPDGTVTVAKIPAWDPDINMQPCTDSKR